MTIADLGLPFPEAIREEVKAVQSRVKLLKQQ